MTRVPSLGPRGEGWFALQLLLLGAALVAGIAYPVPLGGDARLVLAVAGVALVGGGLALALAAVRAFGGAISPLPHPPGGGKLVEHGPYRAVRHPIYVGLISATLGWALLTTSLAALAIVPLLALVLDLKARREEAWLRERYPEYVDYQRRTRRYIPGVY